LLTVESAVILRVLKSAMASVPLGTPLVQLPTVPHTPLALPLTRFVQTLVCWEVDGTVVTLRSSRLAPVLLTSVAVTPAGRLARLKDPEPFQFPL